MVDYFGISYETIRSILLEFEQHGELREHDGRHRADGGRPGPQPLLQPNTLLAVRVKQLVHARQLRNQSTLARDVYDEVLSKFGFANVSLRSVQRFLARLDLVCTHEENDGLNDEWHEKFETRLDRYNYLCLIQEARRQARPIVYIDETYAYERPTRDRLSFIDPNLPWAGEKSGRRLNIVGAVTDSGEVLRHAVFLFEHHRWNGDQLQLFPEYIDRLMRDFSPIAISSDPSDDQQAVSAPVQAQPEEEHDDFKEFFKCYLKRDAVAAEQNDDSRASTSTARKRRRRSNQSTVPLETVFVAHIEYCIWTITTLPADQVN